MRKLVIAIVAGLLLASIALVVWVRSVFTRDTVRDALVSQVATAIGQPVSVQGISASIYPRVTVTLEGVAIGRPARIQVRQLRLGTGLRALLSRQIVGGTVHLDGARVELPLPPLGGTSGGTAPAGDATPPIEIVSIDEIALNDVEVISGGRTLRGTIVAVPHGAGATVRSFTLAADDTRITGSGEIASLAGPVGTLAIRADTLDIPKLTGFLTAFVAGAGLGAAGGKPAGPPPAPAPAPDFTVALETGRAVAGTLALEGLKGRARATGRAVTFDPVEFGVFGGRYQGAMTLTADVAPAFQLRATVSEVDAAALAAFAGSPGVITGRLAGRVALSGRGLDPVAAIQSTAGTARIDVRDGVVRRLGLVRTIVIATSMRAGAASPGGTADDRFSRLGATLAVAGGTARTDDLQFESADVLLRGAGTLRLDGSAIDLTGDVQLSEALSQQSGRDLLRYTQEAGRVTLPVTVRGTAAAPSVRVDLQSAATRALRNKAQEEVRKGLERLFRRRP